MTLIIRRGWREKIITNRYLRPNDVEQLDILEEHLGTITVEDLTVSQARLVLAIQGPESYVFNKRLPGKE